MWGLVLRCWDKSPSARPTAQELFRCLQDASHTWVAPLEYPIADGLDRETGLDSTYGDGRSTVAGTLTGSLLVFVVGVLCALLLPLT